MRFVEHLSHLVFGGRSAQFNEGARRGQWVLLFELITETEEAIAAAVAAMEGATTKDGRPLSREEAVAHVRAVQKLLWAWLLASCTRKESFMALRRQYGVRAPPDSIVGLNSTPCMEEPEKVREWDIDDFGSGSILVDVDARVMMKRVETRRQLALGALARGDGAAHARHCAGIEVTQDALHHLSPIITDPDGGLDVDIGRFAEERTQRFDDTRVRKLDMQRLRRMVPPGRVRFRILEDYACGQSFPSLCPIERPEFGNISLVPPLPTRTRSRRARRRSSPSLGRWDRWLSTLAAAPSRSRGTSELRRAQRVDVSNRRRLRI